MSPQFEFRSISLHWNCEQVSYAAFGPDDARRARIGFELAAQAKNLHVDAAISDILVQMRGLQQVFAAERALWRVQKDNQQGVLTFGQRDGSAGWISEAPGPAVQLPGTKSKVAEFRGTCRSNESGIELPQHRMYAREQRVQLTRSDQGITDANLEPDTGVGAATTIRYDRHVGARPDLPPLGVGPCGKAAHRVVERTAIVDPGTRVSHDWPS